MEKTVRANLLESADLLISCLVECNLRREYYLTTKKRFDLLPSQEVSDASNFFGGLNYILKVDFLGYLAKLTFGKQKAEVTIQNLLKAVTDPVAADMLVEQFTREKNRLQELFLTDENWPTNQKFTAVRYAEGNELLERLKSGGNQILESSVGKVLKTHRDKVFAHFDVDSDSLERKASPKISYVFDFILSDYDISNYYGSVRRWVLDFYLLVKGIGYNFDWIEMIGTKYSSYLEAEGK